MTTSSDNSWTRALMASSGIALGHDAQPHHASPDMREAAAPETPLARLQKLAQVKDTEVREVVARRPDCPMGLLATLAHDRSADVRAGVAGNARLTPAIAEHLARDRETRVLKSLARNHSIPLEVLEALALHRREDVRRVAGRQLDERTAPAEATAGNAPAPAPALGQASELPRELQDRVAPAPEWRPAPVRQPEAEAPPQWLRPVELWGPRAADYR